MKSFITCRRQRGATLVIGLIMLTLITVMVTSSFSRSTSNLKAVGNMQLRDEAIAAANKAIEQVVSSPFTNAPTAETINVDINNDGVVDYVVSFATPACVSASKIVGSPPPPTSISLGSSFTTATSNSYETVWDLDASVTDTSGSGVAVHVRQGVRVLLSQTQYNTVCS